MNDNLMDEYSRVRERRVHLTRLPALRAGCSRLADRAGLPAVIGQAI